eukprot:CAMPEP_0204838540 /NCGR_PEP_ID=MMETSP1346-20131115/31297_1 /ASSEMBLY_ACC=CAM_ASM_000771 /TAXON_ID=215587 /ORGANISM="Aplanochytrium stocchinoi, Strain GSBS06" /LENGTH=584 /DNA_ID=CAMNT_0051974681 /DNA_START=659 /DNA_END=2413 /DNA_ORIENTATION=-
MIDAVLKLSKNRLKGKGEVVDLALMYLLPDELLVQCTAKYLDVRSNVLGLQLANKRMRKLAENENVWFIHTSRLLKLPREAKFWSRLRLCRDAMDPKKRKFGMIKRQTVTCPRIVNDECCWRELYYTLKSKSMNNKEQMDFRGFYTDGGCDGSTMVQKQRYWVGNMFRHGSASHYCSQKLNDINTWGVLSWTRELIRSNDDVVEWDENIDGNDDYLKNERRRLWRRTAILSCFKGSKIPQSILPIIETYELESLLITAIQDFADDLANTKFKAQLHKYAKFKINNILKQKRYRMELSEYRKSLPRKRTQYLEALQRFRIKILDERQSIREKLMIQNNTNTTNNNDSESESESERISSVSDTLVQTQNFLFDSVQALDENMEELIDLEMLNTHSTTITHEKLLENHRTFGKAYGIINSLFLSRVGNFTCPVCVGAVLTCVDDQCFLDGKVSQIKYTESCRALSEAKDYRTLLQLVRNGKLPPITKTKNYKGTIVVEFQATDADARNDKSQQPQPLLWFEFTPKSSNLSINTPSNLKKFQDRNSFTHYLQCPRLSRFIGLKLISSSIGSVNIDVCSIGASGLILQT